MSLSNRIGMYNAEYLIEAGTSIRGNTVIIIETLGNILNLENQLHG